MIASLIENRIIRISVILAAVAAMPPAAAYFWPSPLHAEFMILVGESTDNSIARLQAHLRFLEAEAVKAPNDQQRGYWKNELEKTEKKLEALWRRKLKK